MGIRILQYMAVLGYIFFLIFGLGTFVQKKTNTEVSRKVIHIMLFVVWILLDLFFKGTVHQIIIPVIFIILNALSFKMNIYKSVEREENNHYGTVYFAIAITIIMTIAYFVPAFYLPSGIAVFCLTFGDGFAALAGQGIRSGKVRDHKSTAGMAGAAIASFLAVSAFCLIYDPGISIMGILAIAVMTAIMELVENGMDNFSIVGSTYLLSFILMIPAADASAAANVPTAASVVANVPTAASVVANVPATVDVSSVVSASGTLIESLTAMGITSAGMASSVLIAEGIFIIVFMSKAITYSGSVLSMLIVWIFSYLGNDFMLGYLLATYFTIFGVAVYKKKKGIGKAEVNKAETTTAETKPAKENAAEANTAETTTAKENAAEVNTAETTTAKENAAEANTAETTTAKENTAEVNTVEVGKAVATKKKEGRNFKQIIINGGLGSLAVVLAWLFRKPEFLSVAVISIGGCFIDSVSSDVGTLAAKKPYDIFKRKYVETGISGGMSMLGTVASLVGAVLIGLANGIYHQEFLMNGLLVVVLVMCQTFLDSLMGSLWQVKFRCPKCHKICEKKQHCDVDTVYESGIRWMDNNMVNLLSSLVITVIAFLIFM